MSTAVQVEAVEERRHGGVGRCKCAFWFAVAHDVLGVVVMMVGAFAGLVVHDLFIYGGAIVIFLSLIWWVFWYSGNIDVPPEELQDDVGLAKPRGGGGGGGLSRAVRRVSDRLSSGIRTSFRRSGRPGHGNGRGPGTEPQRDAGLSLATVDNNAAAAAAAAIVDPASSTPKEQMRETLSI